MKIKSGKIKSMNDLVAGVLLMGGGWWLMASEGITEGRILQSQAGLQADSYIRVLGGLVFFLAVLMVVRSFNFAKIKETAGLEFHLTKESFLTFAALVLFIVLLEPLGFAISTFIFSFFTVCLYMLRETRDKGLSREMKIKKIAFAGVFSLVLVVAVYFIFAKGLMITLP